jgi:hypothetical protein
MLALSFLILLEHKQKERSSDLTTLYLVASIISVFLVTVFGQLEQFDRSNHAASVANICLQIILVCFKSIPASTEDIISTPVSQEFAYGVMGRVFYIWVNAILAKSMRSLLKIGDIPLLDEEVSTVKAEADMLAAWRSRGELLDTVALASSAPRPRGPSADRVVV